MSDLHIPVRPDLDQLRHQAKDFLRDIHNGDAEAVAKFNDYHPEKIAPEDAKLADAQLAISRRYGVTSWPRLKQACGRGAAKVWAGAGLVVAFSAQTP